MLVGTHASKGVHYEYKVQRTDHFANPLTLGMRDGRAGSIFSNSCSPRRKEINLNKYTAENINTF